MANDCLGLCPDCSTKLNYRSKKREVKKLKKLAKKPKRRSKHRTSDDDSLSTPTRESSEAGPSGANDNLADSDDSNDVAEPNQQPSESKPAADSVEGSWTKPNSNVEEKTREDEFDEYLEDLLL